MPATEFRPGRQTRNEYRLPVCDLLRTAHPQRVRGSPRPTVESIPGSFGEDSAEAGSSKRAGSSKDASRRAQLADW